MGCNYQYDVLRIYICHTFMNHAHFHTLIIYYKHILGIRIVNSKKKKKIIRVWSSYLVKMLTAKLLKGVAMPSCMAKDKVKQ